MSKDEFFELLRESAKPPNLDKLVEDGTLIKSGAWYIVVKYNKIPQHVWKHVVEMKQTKRKDSTVEVKLKIRDSSKQASAIWKKVTNSVK